MTLSVANKATCPLFQVFFIVIAGGMEDIAKKDRVLDDLLEEDGLLMVPPGMESGLCFPGPFLLINKQSLRRKSGKRNLNLSFL